MKKIKLFFISGAAIFTQSIFEANSQAQQSQHLLDSLLAELPKAKEDTNKINKFLSISYQWWVMNYGDSMLAYGQKALELSLKLSDPFKTGEAYNNISRAYYYLEKIPEGIEMAHAALEINKKNGNTKALVKTYQCLGALYLKIENDSVAKINFEEAVKWSTAIKDTISIAQANNSVGAIYLHNQDPSNASGRFSKALVLFKLLDKKAPIWAVPWTVSNIGYVLELEGDKAAEKGDERKADSLYNKAIEYYQEALNGNKKVNYISNIVEGSNDLGKIYLKMKRYQAAQDNFNKALEGGKTIKLKDAIADSYKGLAKIYEMKGDFKNAYLNHQNYLLYNDTLLKERNAEKSNQMRMQYEFENRASLAKAEQEKKDALALKEIQKQKLVRNGFVGGFAVVLLFAGVFFTQRNKIKKGKKRSDELLLNILPEEVAEELKLKGTAEAKQFDDVTVMFTDFKNFTQISEKLPPAELVAEIHTCFKAFDNIIGKHNIEKIKTIGDSYMCAGGLPVANKTNATDVVSAALEIQQFMQQHLQKRKNEGKEPFEIRIGIHTGPVVAGIVGVKKFAYDIWGDTVNIASRMESSGEAGKVNISGNTYELVKDKFNCIHRGKIQAKNKGEIDMYFVEAKT